MISLKKVGMIVGFASIVSIVITYMSTFIAAYGSEAKAVTIYINNFGEAFPELVMLIIGVPLMTILLVNVWNKIIMSDDE